MAKNILDTIFVENVKFQKESAIRSVFAYQSLEESSGGFSAVAPTPGTSAFLRWIQWGAEAQKSLPGNPCYHVCEDSFTGDDVVREP
ncbi:hypothetical protein Mmc1_1965 [Magnetococcus marinus MC-1]|uniref:Uncharacterized protein n=1 Tax=Magnetococcus marinus (strain ATCC BAA-1437 / JCM 17883 / MC-1) TaxID=156889 RepID=A0L928_MAGMM|nr:hypothetical protein [Magnetococcus marinus]ABK44471.1 hypothetical protein Mmc1_1965 [Magnetococcus marinus MC-1]